MSARKPQKNDKKKTGKRGQDFWNGEKDQERKKWTEKNRGKERMK